MTDAYELWLKYHVNMKTRTLMLTDGSDDMIDDTICNHFIASMHLLLSDGTDPIDILLNSNGGHVDSGMAIYDTIKACPVPTTIKVTGKAYSIAAWILQAADHRQITEHSKVLIHYGTTGLEIDTDKIAEYAKLSKKEEQIYESILLDKIQEKQPDYTIRKLRTLMKKDQELSAREALELGLVDQLQE